MDTGARTGTRWWDVYADRDRWESSHPAARALTAWVESHLMAPHPDLGREGPVCPFVRSSAKYRTFRAAMASGGNGLSVARLHTVIDDAIEAYGRLVRANEEHARSTTLVTIFPGLTEYDRIDVVHRERKSEVVRRGWMLGQFYPGCTVPGLWNRQFHPLDAPLPMLVLRPMMSTDFPFLVERSDWLYAYFTQLAPSLPRRLRLEIADRMRVTGAAATEITALRAHVPGEHAC